MIEAVFISDLHLHPEMIRIRSNFNAFIHWAQNASVKNIYILGDFFHVWAGDDSIDEWSRAIARQLHELSKQGTQLFYMHGNRDFLLGPQFAQLAGWTILPEPFLIQLGDEKVLLAHGDCYCTKDRAHQYFRKLTRNRLFSSLFLKFPLSYRIKWVNKVRQISQFNENKTKEQMDVVFESIRSHITQFNATILIHGHTHNPGSKLHLVNNIDLIHYILSDWDDTPLFLCYDKSVGIFFKQI